MVKALAEKKGLRATFMPKPFVAKKLEMVVMHTYLFGIKKEKIYF